MPAEQEDDAIAVAWHPCTAALLTSLFGAAAFARQAAALATPPRAVCVRANTLRATVGEVRAQLVALAGEGVREAHPGVPEALLVDNGGARQLDDLASCDGREVAVSRRCAEAVLRGADVYVPGVLGCSTGTEAGVLVAVTAVVEPLGASSAGMTRGTVLPRFADRPPRLLLGCASPLSSAGAWLTLVAASGAPSSRAAPCSACATASQSRC